jgi:hypothetical protein
VAPDDPITWGDLARASGLTLLFALPLCLNVWALLDMVRRPRWAWALSGRRQLVWLCLMGVGGMAIPLGLGIAGGYLVWIRPDIKRAESGEIRQR